MINGFLIMGKSLFNFIFPLTSNVITIGSNILVSSLVVEYVLHDKHELDVYEEVVVEVEVEVEVEDDEEKDEFVCPQVFS